MNNYLIWAILHKLNIPKKILDQFQIQSLSNNDINNIKKENTNNNADTPKIYF